MKKKKLSQALPKKISPAQLSDFCFYLQSSYTAGMSTSVAFEAIIPFLEAPLKESIQDFVTQHRDGAGEIECLCTLANTHPEDVLRRIIKVLIFSSMYGALAGHYLEATARSLENVDSLEPTLAPDLVPSDFKMVVASPHSNY